MVKLDKIYTRGGDGGETWPDISYITNLLEPQCQASFIRYDAVIGENLGWLLFANPADRKKRIKMTVRLSRDDGKTWPVSKMIHAGPSAYSSLAVLPDGDIACFYEAGEKSPYEKIVFARFSLEWLTGGKDRR